jgi:hypothetical protein
VPGPGNPQAWDRYAYCLNNPIRLVDPSGHRSEKYYFDGDADWTWSDKWGITLTGDWTYEGGYNDLVIIQGDVEKVGGALQPFTGQSAFDSFKSVMGSVSIGIDLPGSAKGCYLTHCYGGTRGQLGKEWAKGLLIHELGHIFDSRTGASGWLDKALNLNDSNGFHITGAINGMGFVRTDSGYKSASFPDEQHPLDRSSNPDPDWNEAYYTASEDFADMFMNWVQRSFDYVNANNAGNVRNNWMQINMAEFVSIVQGH